MGATSICPIRASEYLAAALSEGRLTIAPSGGGDFLMPITSFVQKKKAGFLIVHLLKDLMSLGLEIAFKILFHH